jgi:hypothetical protein
MLQRPIPSGSLSARRGPLERVAPAALVAACLALVTPPGVVGQSQDRAPAPVRLAAGDVEQRAREARQTIPLSLPKASS